MRVQLLFPLVAANSARSTEPTPSWQETNLLAEHAGGRKGCVSSEDRVGNGAGTTRLTAFPSGALREKTLPRRLPGSVVFEASVSRHLGQVRVRSLSQPRWGTWPWGSCGRSGGGCSPSWPRVARQMAGKRGRPGIRDVRTMQEKRSGGAILGWRARGPTKPLGRYDWALTAPSYREGNWGIQPCLLAGPRKVERSEVTPSEVRTVIQPERRLNWGCTLPIPFSTALVSAGNLGFSPNTLCDRIWASLYLSVKGGRWTWSLQTALPPAFGSLKFRLLLLSISCDFYWSFISMIRIKKNIFILPFNWGNWGLEKLSNVSELKYSWSGGTQTGNQSGLYRIGPLKLVTNVTYS